MSKQVIKKRLPFPEGRLGGARRSLTRTDVHLAQDNTRVVLLGKFGDPHLDGCAIILKHNFRLSCLFSFTMVAISNHTKFEAILYISELDLQYERVSSNSSMLEGHILPANTFIPIDTCLPPFAEEELNHTQKSRF